MTRTQPPTARVELDYPLSLGVYEQYAKAQRNWTAGAGGAAVTCGADGRRVGLAGAVAGGILARA